MKPTTSNLPEFQGHHPAGIPKEQGSLITKKEAAKRLAISIRTLDRLADRGLVGKIYIGGSVRIREGEVAAIVEQGV